MQVLRFQPGRLPEPAGAESDDLTEGFVWVDVERTEADWHDRAQHWLGVRLHERHLTDTLNELHPPYCDGTDDYDLLIVRALCPDCPPEAPLTQPVAFVITATTLVSIRPPGDPVFQKPRERVLASHRNPPASTGALLYLLLDQVINDLLARREVTTELLSRWQERLLDRNDVFDDWRALMALRGRLRRLEVITESQVDAVEEWREQTALPLDESLTVRFNDLGEHLVRVYNHAKFIQHDIDALVQVYFSTNTQRTNEVLKFLTVVSAVFLPLNLLAGIFGTNFAHLPLLQSLAGPWVLLLTMVLIVAGLLVLFRRRHWV